MRSGLVLLGFGVLVAVERARVAPLDGNFAHVRSLGVAAVFSVGAEFEEKPLVQGGGDRFDAFALDRDVVVAGVEGEELGLAEGELPEVQFGMQALDAAGLPVTLSNVHDMICVSEDMKLVLAKLQERSSPAAAAERQYLKDFEEQPDEQKSGTVHTVANNPAALHAAGYC